MDPLVCCKKLNFENEDGQLTNKAAMAILTILAIFKRRWPCV
jgi:hypothetical protein